MISNLTYLFCLCMYCDFGQYTGEFQCRDECKLRSIAPEHQDEIAPRINEYVTYWLEAHRFFSGRNIKVDNYQLEELFISNSPWIRIQQKLIRLPKAPVPSPPKEVANVSSVAESNNNSNSNSNDGTEKPEPKPAVVPADEMNDDENNKEEEETTTEMKDENEITAAAVVTPPPTTRRATRNSQTTVDVKVDDYDKISIKRKRKTPQKKKAKQEEKEEEGSESPIKKQEINKNEGVATEVAAAVEEGNSNSNSNSNNNDNDTEMKKPADAEVEWIEQWVDDPDITSNNEIIVLPNSYPIYDKTTQHIPKPTKSFIQDPNRYLHGKYSEREASLSNTLFFAATNTTIFVFFGM
jgi:hypothetical protein